MGVVSLFLMKPIGRKSYLSFERKSSLKRIIEISSSVLEIYVTCAGQPLTSIAAGLSKATMNIVRPCKKYLKNRSSTNTSNNANLRDYFVNSLSRVEKSY